MKIQTKPPEKGSKTRGDLIRYFDMNWLTMAEILRTSEGITSGLCLSGLKARMKCGKNNTLEKVLKPKRGYKLTKKSNTKEFKGCSDSLIEDMESGSNHVLLNEKKKTIKIKGTFSIPRAYNKPLVTKEIEIDIQKYKQAKNKEQFIKRSFIHAIAHELEVECLRVR